MDDCCSTSASTSPVRSPQRTACPINGKVGRPVSVRTLQALLSVSLTQLQSKEYRFCPDANCPTVYYSADGQSCFTEEDLRERVFQKQPDQDETLVCYCFRHTVGSIRAEIIQTGASTVIDQITAGIQAGRCACDIRNPQGSCCLGNVRQLVQRFQLSAANESYREV